MNVLQTLDTDDLKKLLRKSKQGWTARLLADASFRKVDENGDFIYSADFWDKDPRYESAEILDSGYIKVTYDKETAKLKAW